LRGQQGCGQAEEDAEFHAGDCSTAMLLYGGSAS
jgi:hypothetical protein